MNSWDSHFAALLDDRLFSGLFSLLVDLGSHSGDGSTGHCRSPLSWDGDWLLIISSAYFFLISVVRII